MHSGKSTGSVLIVLVIGMSAMALLPMAGHVRAQQTTSDAALPREVRFTATSAHVSQPGTPISIRILRWSNDEERTPLVAALNPAPPAATSAAPPAGGDRSGGARGGRAAGAGRGGRGAGRGGRGDPGVPLTPVAALTAAIGRASTVGYIWTTDVTGYSIKYAHRVALPDGGERILLATNRRLGGHTAAWTPVGGEAVTDYEFTLIEIRLDAKGLGEGKTSLTSKVVVDNSAKTVALENYGASPALLQNVKQSS